MNPRYDKAFTLIELLVVISIIALLIGILLPALSGSRRYAKQMQSCTQLRGMQQSLVMFAQGNNGYFPGLDADGKVIANSADANTGTHNSGSGATVEGRFALLLGSNYFTGQYAISPGESRPAWTTGVVTPDNVSYAMLQISDDALPSGGKPTGNAGRILEWRQTLNTRAPVMSDRAIGTSADFHSVWKRPAGTTNWSGCVIYNDNHVMMASPYKVNTRYGHAPAIQNDNLFKTTQDGATVSGTWNAQANACLIATGFDTVFANG